MKSSLFFILLLCLYSCNQVTDSEKSRKENPFFTALNQPIDYAKVNSTHIEEYARIIIRDTEIALDKIRDEESPDFNNIFTAYDNVVNELSKANSNCFMLYWVSPDSLSRVKGLEAYQMLDSVGASLTSDNQIYKQMVAFKGSQAYGGLKGPRKNLVDDVIQAFEHEGVNLSPEKLNAFKELKAEINDLSSQYSINMNTANEVLVLDEKGADGLPENFKASYRVADSRYDVPVIPATRRPVLNNARMEETRKSYMMKYQNRASDKNLAILDSLVLKRDKLADLMGYETYASYTISRKMARTPENVWHFLNDLIDRSKEKALKDMETLKKQREVESGKPDSTPINPWDISYYRNQILKSEFQVDQEIIREYLPMEHCLSGMIGIYQELLGLEIYRVDNPSVWHPDVLLYEVKQEGILKGRFYLDLYPRPNKESWFYGVDITPGKLTKQGYEIPVCLLLGNFTGPTESIPSMLSHGELSTLFHEFGHIMDNMCYDGDFATLSDSKEDFVEAMSQIFENWIWDYDILSIFAKNYQTGEVLPRDLFENMLKAKNITSGLNAQMSLRNCVYDMELYDDYDPDNPVDTDRLWNKIDQQMALSLFIEGTHPQASWIHINTHPTYYYGYLWSEVYAQDMFTVFEENGLLDTETGIRYRKLVLANGTQRDIVQGVEEFLGRPSNNEAYIKSLGLN